MATGLPVVATNVGGLPEMVIDGHTGFLVPAGDFRGLADRLLEILSNPVLGRRMGWAGRARVQAEFDLQQTIPLAEQALEEVVSMVTSGGMVPIR
jgi:glycosyltransferase involved in cell wall biosynthesis